MIDEHYQKHVIEREEAVRNLQLQGEPGDEEAEASKAQEEEENMTEEEKERRDMMMKKLEEMQSSGAGVGTSKR